MISHPGLLGVTARLRAKLERLDVALRERAPLVIAFSGGVDSAFLLRVAAEAAPGSVRAILGVSASLQQENLELARRVATRLEIILEETATPELSNPSYVANGIDRCFFCKDTLYRVMESLRSRTRNELLVDGTNFDDLSEIRPGRRAAELHGVWSPLADLGWTKAEIRALSQALALETWDRPASPCLSSRIPHGTPVTIQALKQIERAELFLRRLGFTVVRVRHHGDLARIEVPLPDLPRLTALAPTVAEAFRRVGYNHVQVDPDGYRTGGADASMARDYRLMEHMESQHE